MSGNNLSGYKMKNSIYSGIREDIEDLETVIYKAGYTYDAQQDIFFSVKDAWQRDYGYFRLYDDFAAILNLIYDCEPIYFEYDNKRWLIELWKGQYGMTTGCEIGIYTAEGSDYNLPNIINYLFYNSASDEDCLYMTATLKKNGEPLFTRKDTHWWLTGHILGEFSEPSELELDVSITLKNQEMCQAFVGGMMETGYSEGEIEVSGNTVSFTFSEPYSVQSVSRGIFESLSQTTNKTLCRIYRNYTEDARDMDEALNIIWRKSPLLYSMIISIGKPSSLFTNTKRIYDMKYKFSSVMGGNK